ncbi:helix-turn-helix transcriptional regulator [Actinoplanes sp. NPDC049548]|uniref:helix-turn-helix transcriptional regulator n=1 Tax=Actinoplanes sp. NPDC049548 TaxID=3155152 RepID=UPI003423D2E6
MDIGEFLRSRRARVSPAQLGLVSHGRRRVPGLRREELAQAAGVSVDYYVRLEQGRGRAVSDAVLDAISRVLRLDDAEREHLRNLARPAPASKRPEPRPVRPGLQRLLDAMTDVPAFVLGRRMDIVAWNVLADALYGISEWPASERNAARHAFLSPTGRAFYPDFETVAAETVAYLRLDAGRHPGDKRLATLIGELSIRDETFRRLWTSHDVREKTYGAKRIHHPVVGDLDLTYETLQPPGEPGLLLVTYTCEPGSPTQDRLRLLASWTATVPPTSAAPDRVEK